MDQLEVARGATARQLPPSGLSVTPTNRPQGRPAGCPEGCAGPAAWRSWLEYRCELFADYFPDNRKVGDLSKSWSKGAFQNPLAVAILLLDRRGLAPPGGRPLALF